MLEGSTCTGEAAAALSVSGTCCPAYRLCPGGSSKPPGGLWRQADAFTSVLHHSCCPRLALADVLLPLPIPFDQQAAAGTEKRIVALIWVHIENLIASGTVDSAVRWVALSAGVG
jgi:hypothetical protein